MNMISAQVPSDCIGCGDEDDNSHDSTLSHEPHSHCTLVPENCQKIAGVPSVWTQTRPGIDPGLGT